MYFGWQTAGQYGLQLSTSFALRLNLWGIYLHMDGVQSETSSAKLPITLNETQILNLLISTKKKIFLLTEVGSSVVVRGRGSCGLILF